MSVAEQAARDGLHRVGARPPLRQYLADAWGRREFAVGMAKYKIAARDESNRLGVVWIVLRPTLNAIVYGSIFGLLQGSSRPENFAAYVVIGVFLFDFFSTSMNKGAKAITGNRSLVQSLSFPRVTLPMSVVVEQFMSLVPMLGVMVAFLLVLGERPQVSWLMMVPLLILFALFNAGVAMIGARLTVHLRDLTQLLPFITRLLFYSSGVLFDVNRILSQWPAAVYAFDFHPIYEVLTIARGVLMEGQTHPPIYWLYLSIWTLVVFVGGFVFFWVAEERYGRVD